MKILVPIKRVFDPYAKPRPLPDGSGLDTSGQKFDINPFDEIALEEAVRQKEKNPSIDITVVSIGAQECEEQLRKALAMGADQAILILAGNRLEPLAVASELKELAKELGVDLVLMGKQSTDEDNNQTGQMLAAKLGWPQATFASKVTLGQDQVEVVRETDTGEETLSMPLPCVVTADLRLNEPRYIALPGIIKARSKPLEVREAKTALLSKIRVVKYEASPGRPPGRKVSDVAELVSSLRERGVI